MCLRPSSKKGRTYFTPLLGDSCGASAATVHARSYSCDYSKRMWLKSRGFSWSFYHEGQGIIKLPVMSAVWKYACATESGLDLPLGCPPACSARMQTLNLSLEFLWSMDIVQSIAPVSFLYLLSNTCFWDLMVWFLSSGSVPDSFCLFLYLHFH